MRAAALRLIARDGFAAVSMRQIAAEVGVQVGTLYNYTSDKQSLLFELMAGHMEELLADLAAQDWAELDPLGRLDAFTRFHIRWHLPRRDAVFVSYMELRNLTPENFERIEALRHAYEDALEQILRDGLAEGQFVLGEPRVTTMALIALITGVTSWYRPHGRLDLKEIEGIYVDLMHKAVGIGPDHLMAAQ